MNLPPELVFIAIVVLGVFDLWKNYRRAQAEDALFARLAELEEMVTELDADLGDVENRLGITADAEDDADAGR